MRRVEIEPYDVVLFRDARPFGAATAAGTSVGLFPPPPTAIYGALRTAVFRASGTVLRYDGPPEVVDETVLRTWGDAHRLGSATCRGPVLCCDEGALWPAPVTLMAPKEVAGEGEARGAARDRFVLATPAHELPFKTASLFPGLRPPWVTNPEVVAPAAGYLTTEALAVLLRGTAPTGGPLKEYDVVIREDREGIAVQSSSRTVRTGALFTMGFRRLREGKRLAVWIDGDEGEVLPAAGLLRLGQDGRLARYIAVANTAEDWPAKPLVTANRFLFYLATPARFAQGWLPSWITPGTLDVQGKPFGARLVSVALDRPQMLGGWDLAGNRPRALHRFVRAGSVYFFEAASAEDAQQAVNALHGSCISDAAGEDGTLPQAAPEMGFGFCLTGVW